jgi:hypothetical protein
MSTQKTSKPSAPKDLVTLSQAAVAVNRSVDALRRWCRDYGLKRWPLYPGQGHASLVSMADVLALQAQLSAQTNVIGAAQPKAQSEKQYKEEVVSSYLQEQALDLQSRNGVVRNRAITTAYARDELFFGALTRAMDEIFKNKITAQPYKPKKKETTERQVNLLLSDLHFGAMLDPREVPLKYGTTEEARRLAAVVVQAGEYKPQYRDCSTLMVHLAGDIIQNQLHDPRDGAPLAEQIATAIHLLTQALTYLATKYKLVEVRCATGNHGRFVSRHKERATFQKWDSIETIIYFAVKTAIASIPNINMEIGYTPYYLYDSFGARGMVTHGDTVIRPGFPGSSIDTKSVRSQINEFNAARVSHEQVSLFAVGHVHTGSVVQMGNGAVFISNGALIPPDPYAGSIGIHESVCGQTLWESVPGHIFGDYRFLCVDSYTDQDSSLEKVIKPFTGF